MSIRILAASVFDIHDQLFCSNLSPIHIYNFMDKLFYFLSCLYILVIMKELKCSLQSYGVIINVAIDNLMSFKIQK